VKWATKWTVASSTLFGTQQCKVSVLCRRESIVKFFSWCLLFKLIDSSDDFYYYYCWLKYCNTEIIDSSSDLLGLSWIDIREHFSSVLIGSHSIYLGGQAGVSLNILITANVWKISFHLLWKCIDIRARMHTHTRAHTHTYARMRTTSHSMFWIIQTINSMNLTELRFDLK